MAPLLSVRDLRTWFDEEELTAKAVDGVSFDLARGETLGIVGESGSGKSVTNLSIMRLVPQPPGRIVSGEIFFDGVDLLTRSPEEMRKIRGKRIAMIFQDPMTSLNPFMRVSQQLMEVTQLHLGHSKAEAYAHAVKMLETVGIPDARRRADGYPHEFSGGMRQRVMIAMALSCQPELLIADEPTTALDVTIQAQILELIKSLKRETGTSVIMITHDLGVVAGMTDRIMVMYAGKVFETAPTAELFARPSNPYTAGLLRSVPDPTDDSHAELYQIPGLPPDVARLPPGCPFAPRCARAEAICREQFPPVVELSPQHHSLCHFAEEIYAGPAEAGPHDRHTGPAEAGRYDGTRPSHRSDVGSRAASVVGSGAASVMGSGSASVARSGAASVAESGAASVAGSDAASVVGPDAASGAESGAASVAGSGVASVAESGAASVAESGAASVAESGAASVAESRAASVAASGVASVAASGAASIAGSGAASVAGSGSASVAASGAASVAGSDSASVTGFGSASVVGSGFSRTNSADPSGISRTEGDQ